MGELKSRRAKYNLSTRLFHHQCGCHRWKDDIVNTGHLGPCDPWQSVCGGFQGLVGGGVGRRQEESQEEQREECSEGQSGQDSLTGLDATF